MEEQQTPAQRLLGDFAPKMVQLTDDVLFGDVWKRPGLSPRDRSLVTVAVLAATYRPDQLNSHLRLALANGIGQFRASYVGELGFVIEEINLGGSAGLMQIDNALCFGRKVWETSETAVG